MAPSRRLDITQIGDVTVVRFLDRKIFDAANIQQLGVELFALVEQQKRAQILLNLANVEFLSSAALNKLIMLEKKIKNAHGKLKLTDLRPEIHEVFVITRLDQMFDISPTEVQGLASF